MKRAHWFWLDLLSIIAINFTPLLCVLSLEFQMRATIPLHTLRNDIEYLSGAPAPTLISRYEAISYWTGFPDYFATKFVVGQAMYLHGHPTAYNLGSTEAKVFKTLLTYVKESKLGPISESQLQITQHKLDIRGLKLGTTAGCWVYEDSIKTAFRHMETLWFAHHKSALTSWYLQVTFLLVTAVILGLQLCLSGLPALTGQGLLGGLAFTAVSGMLVSIVGLIPSTTEYSVYLILAICLGTLVLIAAAGLIRQKSTFLIKASLAAVMLVLPTVGAIGLGLLYVDVVVIHRDFLFYVVLGVAMLAPCWQYCFNRLHAAPD